MLEVYEVGISSYRQPLAIDQIQDSSVQVCKVGYMMWFIR